MCKQMEVMKEDFHKMFSELKEDYSPNDIAILANIGSVILAKMELSEKMEEKTEEITDEIKDELMGAEKYLQKYAETSDPQYRTMAQDELRHADYFIKHSRMVVNNPVDVDKLQSYTGWYTQLLNRAM